MAARSRASIVFPHTNTERVGSNPILQMDICRVLYICVFPCMQRPYDWLIPLPRSPTDCLEGSSKFRTDSEWELVRRPNPSRRIRKRKQYWLTKVLSHPFAHVLLSYRPARCGQKTQASVAAQNSCLSLQPGSVVAHETQQRVFSFFQLLNLFISAWTCLIQRQPNVDIMQLTINVGDYEILRCHE